jgi:hypothetical protein
MTMNQEVLVASTASSVAAPALALVTVWALPSSRTS